MSFAQKVSENDERLLYRFLDGELVGDETVACRARLEREPLLRQALQAMQDRARGFVTVRSEAMVAPAGFNAKVLAAARRLPERAALREAEVGASVVVMCRRLLLAAAILFGIGFLWHSGLLDGGLLDGRATDSLQATPREAVDREMKRLDDVILSWKAK